jgi:predicted ABC-type ATPase
MIELPSPVLVVFGGPNGAGKTTTARELLPAWKIDFFLNADMLAATIAPFAPERAALTAGRILFEQQAALLERRETFAIESTLSSAQHPRRLMLDAKERGYHVHLVYMWLSSDDLSKARRQACSERRASYSRGGPPTPLPAEHPESARRLHSASRYVDHSGQFQGDAG